ncbi:jhy protein homolog [Toxotes jaculatrix]|uniref:jhy protein homolog n=1 Tax=Toxotes jaculatrix TaxID=941984 RepID=UPI001B3AF9D5|nr:jhy protein homolog [Toxotes jaculatrix]
MDEGLRHGRMCPVLKTEQKMPPSPRQAILAKHWESGESDTESLAQEKAYQQQLQMRIDSDQNKYALPQEESSGSFQQGDGQYGDVNDDETGDLQVYDSLEVASNPHAKRNPTLVQTEYLDTQMDEREGSCLLSDDAYSDLRYDPNWRTNLTGNSRFNESPQSSVEEYHQLPEEKSTQSYGDRQRLEVKGGYRYITDTSPAVMVTSHLAAKESDQPYHLHPQDGQTSSVTSPHGHKHASQHISPEADLSRSPRISTKNDSDNSLYRESRKKGENSCVSPKLTKEMNATGLQTYYQQKPGCTQGGPIQKISTSTLNSPKGLSNKKLQRQMDIVERNKITLGCSTSPGGSYVKVHALKQEMPLAENEVHETGKETASAETQEDPELRWLQRTQQLRVTHLSMKKKSQQKEYPNPSRQPQPPALAVEAEQGDCLSSPLARPAAVTQPKPQKTTSSQPLPPTIHLNISLSTSSHLLSLLQQKGQDAIIDLASLHGRPRWSPTSQVQLALSPAYQQTNPGKSFRMPQEGLNAQLHQPTTNLQSIPEQWQRTAALSYEGEDQTWSSNEVHTKQFSQNLPRTPTTASSQGLGSYTVLPPIERPLTGKESNMSSGQSVNTAYPIHRSSSDSYLVQMEKQKQLRAKATCKTYKQLKTDINLRGLHPDYTAMEKTKMKRQKLYSNVIREQNKKINRNPFRPAKDLEGSDKTVPRMKALEYAKTIAKPPVQPPPKQRMKQQSEGFTEGAAYCLGMDVNQLTRLDLLRKRHEEEKQAVALFRKVHAV